MLIPKKKKKSSWGKIVNFLAKKLAEWHLEFLQEEIHRAKLENEKSVVIHVTAIHSQLKWNRQKEMELVKHAYLAMEENAYHNLKINVMLSNQSR